MLNRVVSVLTMLLFARGFAGRCVTVKSASGLRDEDGLFAGASDPYARVVPNTGGTQQTQVINENHNPTWNRKLCFGSITSFSIVVMDSDGGLNGADDHLGTCSGQSIEPYDTVRTCSLNTQGSVTFETSQVTAEDSIRQSSGYLEVYKSGSWRPVCDDGWKSQNSQVVCRQLGLSYSGGAVKTAVNTGQSVFWMDDVNCNGGESNLNQCAFVNHHGENCAASEGVQIPCVGDITIRQSRGWLEVHYNERWQPVCDDGWTTQNSKVVCKQLGFSAGSFGTEKVAAQSDTNHFWLDDVSCSGSESNLGRCSHIGFGNENCNGHEAFKVVCQELRQTNGYLEVFHNGVWLPVCDDGWTTANSEAACRQLGESHSSAHAHIRQVTANTDDFWLDQVSCTGSENNLKSCNHNPLGQEDCTRSEAFKVICNGSSLSSTTMTMNLLIGSALFLGIVGIIKLRKNYNELNDISDISYEQIDV